MSKFQVEKSWVGLLEALGVDSIKLLEQSELPRDLFAQEYAYLSAGEYFRLWETMEAMLDNTLFPLQLVKLFSENRLNSSCLVALCNPNLLQAISRLAKYKPLVGLMRLESAEQANSVEVVITVDDYLSEPPWSLVLTELMFITQLGRLGSGVEIKPLQVSVTQPLQQISAYTDFFGVEPQLTDKISISFTREDMERPFICRNDGFWESFEPELSCQLAQLENNGEFTNQVRNILLELLPAGLSSADAVAERLHVSKRTLQRRLQNENTHFQYELEQTRLNLAKHYLSRTQLPNTQIAFLLGFADPNSFYRAFQSWTKTTPESYRSLSTSSS